VGQAVFAISKINVYARFRLKINHEYGLFSIIWHVK
jgi:hypothetical protein